MGKIYPQLEASGVRVIGVGMELLSPLTKLLSHRVATHNLLKFASLVGQGKRRI
jgi:hypothetical protein